MSVKPPARAAREAGEVGPCQRRHQHVGDHLDRQRCAKHGRGLASRQVVGEQPQSDRCQAGACQGNDLRQEQVAISAMFQDGEHGPTRRQSISSEQNAMSASTGDGMQQIEPADRRQADDATRSGDGRTVGRGSDAHLERRAHHGRTQWTSAQDDDCRCQQRRQGMERRGGIVQMDNNGGFLPALCR